MSKKKKQDPMQVLMDELPKKIRVLGKDWVIEHNEDLITDKSSYGRCHVGHAKIEYTTVDGDGEPLNVPMVKDTIIHELVHAIEETAGLGLKERQVLGLGGGLYALIKENPGLILWLMKKHAEREDPTSEIPGASPPS